MPGISREDALRLRAASRQGGSYPFDLEWITLAKSILLPLHGAGVGYGLNAV